MCSPTTGARSAPRTRGGATTMSTLALADTTNTHSPGVTTRAAKKYSDGGTALGAYDAFGGGGAPPLPTSARAARHESPATTGGTPAPEAREVQTPTPLSSSTDADADDSSPSAARGWHVPPAASSTRPARERVPPDVAPPSASSADVRYLRAKVLALEGKCAELARENERAHLERRGPRAPAQQPAAPAPRPAGLQAAAARARLAAGPRAPTREAEAQATQRHDVFGELLATLGHKRVYLASARALIEHVPIWCRQRPVERARVAEIRAAKAAEGMRFPGVISVFEVRATGAERLAMPQPVGIFDGQHRLCAIAGELAHWGAPPPEPRAAAGAADGRAAAAQQPQPAAQGAAGGACSVAAVAGEEDPGRRRSTRSSAAADGSAYAHEPPAAHGPGAPGAEGGAASVPTPEQQQRAPPPAPPPLDDVQLVVDVYPVQSEEEVKRWYLELNKAETVKVRCCARARRAHGRPGPRASRLGPPERAAA